MSFISYAQNFEDVILWRALKHVENGFYIDVGANDPSVDSVTKAFYDRGWNGVNIEPLLAHSQDLLKERPRDINLQCAAGECAGKIEIWDCEVRGWGTASKETIALHQQHGYKGVIKEVPVLPLSDICKKYVEEDIHFLKIDVEGLEKSVIKGMDFSNFRPWILIVEATKPGVSEETYEEWESMVLDNDYSVAYTDGLNRFYVSNEHSELLSYLKYPPNVFDDFIRYEQLNSEFMAQQAEAKAQQVEVKAQQAEVKAQQAEVKAQQVQAELQEAYSSRSWRITAPLRVFVHQLRLCRKHGLKQRLIVISKKIFLLNLSKVTAFLKAKPHMWGITVKLSRKIGVYTFLRRMLIPKNDLDNHAVALDIYMPKKTEHLSAAERRICIQLEEAIEKNRKQS